MTRTAIAILVLLAAPATAPATDNFERKVPYAGPRLPAGAMLCRSNHSAAGGFWRTDLATNRVEEAASVATESQTTTWRITLKSDHAEVIRFTGATQALEQAAVFSAEPTSAGILLISKDRTEGESPEIITLDPANSSFVYSTQHVTPLYNRANIFYGACVPAP